MTTGWYPNPSGAPGMRYWDGAAWRDAVSTPAARTNWLPLIIIGSVILGILGVLLAVAMLVVPSGHKSTPIPPGASSQDVAFLRAMDERGISNEDGPRAEIAAARNICDLLGQGYSINGLAEHYTLTSKSTMSSDNMHYFIQTAAATYCPQHVR